MCERGPIRRRSQSVTIPWIDKRGERLHLALIIGEVGPRGKGTRLFRVENRPLGRRVIAGTYNSFVHLQDESVRAIRFLLD